ncbi:nuclear transport factor 2 family protein [Streptomyces sp. NPDC005244]|uniref:nuclear transport factor 2 family protein n=1 Tax=Streptomyces sp. NPDC005244 TaxID=3364708 RepID=UPI0036BDA969
MEFRPPQLAQLAGSAAGVVQEFTQYFRALWPVFVEGASESEIGHILVDGDEAALFGRFTHTVKSTDRRFTIPVAFHLTVPGGRIERLHLFEDTLTVAQAMPTTGT